MLKKLLMWIVLVSVSISAINIPFIVDPEYDRMSDQTGSFYDLVDEDQHLYFNNSGYAPTYMNVTFFAPLAIEWITYTNQSMILSCKVNNQYVKFWASSSSDYIQTQNVQIPAGCWFMTHHADILIHPAANDLILRIYNISIRG